MRLGQLARKLEVSPTQIINLLHQKEFSDIEGTNSKLNDEQIAIVNQAFLQKESPVSEDTGSENKTVVSLPPEDEVAMEQLSYNDEIDEEIIIQSKSEVTEEVNTLSADEHESELVPPAPEPELIKAPKIDLPGLKVVGKISLPEPKEEEVAEAENDEQEQQQEAKEKKRPARQRGIRKARPVQNIVAFERSRKEKKERRVRELNKKREKEKRKKYYQENFARTVEPMEKVEEPEEIVMDQVEEEKPKSKNWLVRIWRALDAK